MTHPYLSQVSLFAQPVKPVFASYLENYTVEDDSLATGTGFCIDESALTYVTEFSPSLTPKERAFLALRRRQKLYAIRQAIEALCIAQGIRLLWSSKQGQNLQGQMNYAHAGRNYAIQISNARVFTPNQTKNPPAEVLRMIAKTALLTFGTQIELQAFGPTAEIREKIQKFLNEERKKMQRAKRRSQEQTTNLTQPSLRLFQPAYHADAAKQVCPEPSAPPAQNEETFRLPTYEEAMRGRAYVQ